ncbi:MAG: sulfatase-like hydrolase/transferase [Verrucomicrobiales bacterium]|nr:sulfatase-like hydrolase/transferase [Verrucomicrobiales bacterium]
MFRPIQLKYGLPFSLLLFVMQTAFCGGSSDSAKSDDSPPPNIIFIFADDISAHRLSPYGGDIEMPVLDRIGQSGIRFDTAWSSPLCGPSRAILQTGKYPQNQGYWDNAIVPELPYYKDPRHHPWMRVARDAGYTTAFFDKLHPDHPHHESSDLGAQMEAYGADYYVVNRYWDGYDGPDQGRGGSERRGAYGVSWYWHPGLIRNREPVMVGADDFGPDMIVSEIKSFIRENQEQPFFVYWPTNLPHKAYDPVAGRWSHTDVPEVDGSGRRTGNRIPGSLASNMGYLDILLGEIEEQLETLGLLENTILFFVSDNGTADGDKGSFDRDRALRVPWVVSGGPVSARGSSKVMVSLVDMWPTIADLTGYEGPRNTDGHSFAPYLLGEDFVPRDTLLMAMNNARWVRDSDWLLDGRGQFWDVHGADSYHDYRKVSLSRDPEVIQARLRLEAIRDRELELPDYTDPLTRKGWRVFRRSKPPVKVFRPDFLPKVTAP